MFLSSTFEKEHPKLIIGVIYIHYALNSIISKSEIVKKLSGLLIFVKLKIPMGY